MRNIKVITSLLLLIISLSSCVMDNGNSYDSLICDATNDGFNIKSECNFWTGEYFVKENMPEQRCNVLGKQWVGEYKQSIIEKFNSFTTDIYQHSDGVQFGLRSDSGKLVFINYMNDVFFETEPYLDEVSAPAENALQVAKSTAKFFVDNIEEYDILVYDPVTRYKEKDGKEYVISYHEITFAKKLQGLFSSDYISIKVTSKGNIALIIMGDIGTLDDADVEYDLDAVNTSINDKVNKICSAYGYTLDAVRYKTEKLVVTPEGHICVYSVINLTITTAKVIQNETKVYILTVIGTKG